jgi:WD40 repeat protein
MTQLGKYQLHEYLGSGAFADVYRATDTNLKRTVALKVLKPALLADQEAFSRFVQEAQVAGGLFHPHIATVLDLGEADGRHFIAMRYVDGPSLDKVIAERAPLPWDEAVNIITQVAGALEYAHNRGLVHRDIKPQNILLSPGEGAVLTDFGLVRAMEASGMSTRSGAILGTPQYIPPEVWNGRLASTASDQYALACVFFELLSGQALFSGQTPAELVTRHIIEGPKFPEKWPPGSPPGVENALRKALSRLPQERYASVSKFVQALQELNQPRNAASVAELHLPVKQQVEAQEPEAQIVAEASSVVKPPSPLPKGTGRIVGGVLLAALLIFVSVLGWQAAARREAVPATSLITQPTAQSIISATTTPSQIPAPTQTPTETATPTLRPQPVLIGTAVMQPVISIAAENADRVEQLARWGTGTYNEIAWSPDGTFLAVASSLGLYLYDTQTLDEIHFIETDSSVDCLSFSPDGNTLAAGSYEGTIYILNLLDYELLLRLDGGLSEIWSVAFTPDGLILASGSLDGTIRLWNIPDGRLLRILEGHEWGVESIAFSPDGLTLASGADDYTLRLWNVSDGSLVRTLGEEIGQTSSVAFSPDGLTLASGSNDRTIRLWNVSDGSLLRSMKGDGSIRSITFSPNGQILVSGSLAHTIQFWNVSNGILLRSLEEHTSSVNSIAISPDGLTLASMSGDTIRLWNISDGSLLRSLEGHFPGITSVAFSPNGMTMTSGSGDGNIRQWNLSDGSLLRTLSWQPSEISSIAFSPDGLTLASGSLFDSLRLWNVSDGSLLSTLEKDRFVTFSPDGHILASWSWTEQPVRLWNVLNGNLLHSLGESAEAGNSVAFSPDGQTLAVATGMTINLWNVSDGSLLRTVEHDSLVYCVGFSPDGQILASGSSDKNIYLWRVMDWRLLHTLRGHLNEVLVLAFSPDGQTLASGSHDYTIRLWGVEDGRLLHTLNAHMSYVNNLTFSPDGILLTSGSGDGTIRLWGIAP